MSFKPKHILVIRMSAMGDVAMTVPVLRVLTSANPALKITVLTRKLFKPFFENISGVDVYVPDLKSKHKGILGLYRLSQELKRMTIDGVADLHDVLRSQIVRTFLKWKGVSFVSIDKGRAEKTALTRKDQKIFKQLKSTHQRYADVFAQLGYPIDLGNHQFEAIDDISDKTVQLLQLLCPNMDDYNQWIGIAPFAKHLGKTYPIDLIEEVIDTMSKRKMLIFLFGGGEDETKLLQAIDNQYPNVINTAQRIKIGEELKLIHKLDMMISMDSANMHMASMVGTRVLSLWGATHPFTGFYGFNQRPSDALFPDKNLYPHLPCSIYGNKVLTGYEDCMRSIEPSAVVSKIEEILEAN